MAGRRSEILWGQVRVFKNKPFTRFARKSGIGDGALCRAIHEAERGPIAADLGGGVIKQRIARSGQGKSSGFRIMILFKVGVRAFFIHGFSKNERTNIRDDELAALKRLAAELLAAADAVIARALACGTLIEVMCDE